MEMKHPLLSSSGGDELPSTAVIQSEFVVGDEWCQLWPPRGTPPRFENFFDKEVSFSLFLPRLPKEVNCTLFLFEVVLRTGSLGQSGPSS